MNRDDLRDVLALIAPLKRKLMLAASRCVASIVRDSTMVQNAQVENLSGEAFDPIEHMQPGGLTHVPLSGAEGVRLTMAGVYDDSVVLALSNRPNRPKDLGAGETALYNASPTQTTITIRANGDVEVTLAAGAKLKVGGASDGAALGSKVNDNLAAIALTLAEHAAKLSAAGFAPDPTKAYVFNPLTDSVSSEILVTD